ncbi:hypothetical protein V5799_010949 [Amblyomma americanum]|uniref:Uncharacterized protein n=1 Tax=Amblyomma americanum TaxID=6943 RepID=A0AAQ4EI94_AMBAM
MLGSFEAAATTAHSGEQEVVLATLRPSITELWNISPLQTIVSVQPCGFVSSAFGYRPRLFVCRITLLHL